MWQGFWDWVSGIGARCVALVRAQYVCGIRAQSQPWGQTLHLPAAAPAHPSGEQPHVLLWPQGGLGSGPERFSYRNSLWHWSR